MCCRGKTRLHECQPVPTLGLKHHLVGQKIGVYDLDLMSFRTGNVEDKVSMTTRLDFDFDEDYDADKLDFIDEMINGYFTTLETARWFKKPLGSRKRNVYILIETLGDYYHKLPREFIVCAKQQSGGAEPENLAMKNRRLCTTHEPEESAKYLTSKFKTFRHSPHVSSSLVQ